MPAGMVRCSLRHACCILAVAWVPPIFFCCYDGRNVYDRQNGVANMLVAFCAFHCLVRHVATDFVCRACGPPLRAAAAGQPSVPASSVTCVEASATAQMCALLSTLTEDQVCIVPDWSSAELCVGCGTFAADSTACGGLSVNSRGQKTAEVI